MGTAAVILPITLSVTEYADAAALTAATSTALSPGVGAVVTNLGFYQLDPTSTSAPNDTSVIAATQGNWIQSTQPYVILDETNKIDGSQLGDAVTIAFGSGSATLPSIHFNGDTNTGMYRVAANEIGLATNGVLRVSLSTTALTSTLPFHGPDGIQGTPTFRMTSEATGMYLHGAGILGLSIAGLLKASLSATALNLDSGVALHIDGIQVVGDRNTGWTTFAGVGTKNHAAINVDTITASDANLRLLGKAVKGIQDALTTHGLIGS